MITKYDIKMGLKYIVNNVILTFRNALIYSCFHAMQIFYDLWKQRHGSK